MSSRSWYTRGFAALLTAALVAAAIALPSVPERPPADPTPPVRDWPMFGGTPARNLTNAFEKNLPVAWDVTPGKHKNIKWVADLGSKAYGGAVISDGRIFVGTNNMRPREKKWDFIDKNTGRLIDLGVLMCFRESDGKFLWQAVHRKLPGGQVIDWPYEGICSMPVVDGNRLYYVSNRCEVVCADVADGKALWTLDMIKELGVFPHNMSACSPLIVDDLVMVVTANGVNEDHFNIPAPQAPSFLAVHKKTGKVVWQNNAPTAKLVGVDQNAPGQAKLFKQLVNDGDLLMHAQWSNPAFAVVQGVPQVVFPGGDGWLYAFTPDGKLLWKFDANPKNAKYNLRTGERSDFIGSPVIYKNRVYIGLGQDPEHGSGVGHLWCIDMTRKGDVSPELRVNDKIVKNPNSAVVWHYGGAITDKEVQKKLRRYDHFGRTMSTCAIHDDLVYAADLRGVVHCLDANTGAVQWEHDTRAVIWSSPFYADGKVYLGTDDGTVFVFAHGRQKKLLAEFDMEARVRTVVVANAGVLFITTENRLYAIAQAK